MVRPARVAGPGRFEVDPEARLALTESLRLSSDIGDCAGAVLRFVAEAGLALRGFCATLDPGEGRLVGIASHGLRGDSLDVLLRKPEVREALLELAVESRGGAELDVDAFGPRGAGALHGLPLGDAAASPELGSGVLVVETPRGSELPEAVRWAARLLGERMHTLRFEKIRNERNKLQRENERLTSIVAAVSDPVLFTDPDGRILVANASAERLLTVGEESSEGRRRAVALNNLLFSASLARTGPLTGSRELPLVDPAEGRDLLFELMTKPASVGPGDGGIVSVLRDVTDLRRASEEIENNVRRLRAAEAEGRSERDRLRLLLGSVAEPVLVTDPAGDIELMNPPAERLLTVAADAPEGAATRVKTNDAVFTSFLSNLSTTRDLQWRGRLHLLDPLTGVSLPMEAISAEVPARDGGSTAFITILHDLTEAIEKEALYEQVKNHSEELRQRVREATKELAEQNELLRRQALELEQASAMKSQFLASMSHELRTPLNAIIGYNQILADGVAGPISAKQLEKLRRVDGNARQLLALINDLLDISRIEAGKMPVDRKHFQIPDLVDEVVEELEPLIHGSGLAFEVAIQPDLLPVCTDRQKVKQIVVNLLSNALKFTEQGSVRITGWNDPAGDRICIAVVDTGVGISLENQRLIFEAFAQARRSSDAHRGTGLGLAISQRLAAVLGGEIRLESALNKGSIFTLILPAEADLS